MSPNENEQPRRGLRTVAAGSALLKRLPLMSHRPHPSASRPRSSRCSDPTPSSGPPTSPSYPGDQAIELLAWMAPA